MASFICVWGYNSIQTGLSGSIDSLFSVNHEYTISGFHTATGIADGALIGYYLVDAVNAVFEISK